MELAVFEISNSNGMRVEVLNLGGIITKLLIPNKNRSTINVVLGYDNYRDYLNDTYFIGGIIGRYANRISKGSFELDGLTYRLHDINDGMNHLHSGNSCFNKKFWKVKKVANNRLILNYISKDMEEGYPGNLTLKVIYELTNSNELNITYHAQIDRPSIINLTNHASFNLSGERNSSILNHSLKIYSTEIVEVDQHLIPTGEIKDISNSPFDFSNQSQIGKHIINNNENLKATAGYDHCYAFKGTKIKPMAELYFEESGIQMTTLSSEPGLQLYTGNNLSSPYKPHCGVCLETQHFPNSMHHAHFPSVVIRPNEDFHSSTIYKFIVT